MKGASGQYIGELLQGSLSVLCEPDGVTGLIQEVRLELADVRIAIDDQDECLASVSGYVMIVQHSSPTCADSRHVETPCHFGYG